MKNKLKTNSKPLIGTVKLHFIHIELLYKNSIHQVSSSFSQIPTTFKMQLYNKWVWLWCGQMYIQCHQASGNHHITPEHSFFAITKSSVLTYYLSAGASTLN